MARFVLAQVSFAVVRAASRQLRAGGLCSFRWFPFFLGGRSFTKFVSVVFDTASARRCFPARATTRAGLSPFYRVVSFSNGGSGPLDETALSSPPCTQRSVCRGAALASRPDPLVPSGDERGRSKAMFFTAPRCICRRFKLLQSREPWRAWSQLFTLCCDTATVVWLCSQSATFQTEQHIAAFLIGSQFSFKIFRSSEGGCGS